MGKTALLFAAAMLALAASAQPIASKREAPVRGAAGAVIQYQEKAGENVLYLEEKGGLVTTVAPPVPRNPEAVDPPAATSAARNANVPAADLPREARRRAAGRDAGASKP